MNISDKNNIPEFFLRLSEKSLVPEEKIFSSGDGFFAGAVSLSAIFEKCGIKTFPSEGEELPCELFFDDWYIYSVEAEGKTAFSLFKMREQEFDRRNGVFADGDIPGVTVSFVEINLPLFEECLEKTDFASREKLGIEINRIASFRKEKHSPILKKYFSDEKSKGAYLVARLYTDFIASLSRLGFVPVPEKYSEIFLREGKTGRLPSFIEKNNSAAGKTVCDHENIFIEDKNSPSAEERLAILATHTGNTSFFSFAAEVRFHALFLIPALDITLPVIGKNAYQSAVRADMSIGDSAEGKMTPYYREDSRIVASQLAIHKNDVPKKL